MRKNTDVYSMEYINFTDNENPYEQQAEVFGDYEIVEMSLQEYGQYIDSTQDSWISEEYKGKIVHIQEIKL